MTPLILITSHSAHVPIVQALESKAFARVMVVGGGEFNAYFNAAHARLDGEIHAAHVEWSQVSERLPAENFWLSGSNLALEVATSIDGVVSRNLPLFHVLEATFEDLQRENPIGLVIVHNDVTPLMRMLIAVAERFGVPSLHLPHGIELSRMALENFDDVVRTTWVAPIGEHCRDWFLANPHPLNKPEKIVPMGRPEWDDLYRHPLPCREEVCLAMGLEPSRQVVGFAGSWGHDLTTFDMGDELERRFRGVLRAIRACDPIPQVLVRPHPASTYVGLFGSDWHSRIAAEEGVEILVPEVTQEAFLAASDLIISMDSTFGTLALVAGRLSMSIAWQHPGNFAGSGYDGFPGIAACSGDDEAIQVTLHRCLFDEEYRSRLAAARDETLQRLNHGHDGRATERVVEWIGNLLKGRAKSMSSAYYQHARPEVLALIPSTASRVLDVGCAAGALGRSLKERQACSVTGIEYVADVALQAKVHLDHVLTGEALEAMKTLPKGSFDCIVFADVLEHLVEPERCLAEASRLLTPGGTVVASIPNVRHWSVIKDLLEGRWDYQDEGILDRTHLRFFTRDSVVRMFTDAGFNVSGLSGTVLLGVDVPPGLADMLVRMGIDSSTLESEGRIYQYLLAATPADAVRSPEQSERAVSIVIPVFNKVEYTERCLEALAQNTPADLFEVIIVDNASSDGTSALLDRLEGDVAIHRNSQNLGFARACNQGAQRSRGKYIVFLNNDTLPQAGWLEALLEEAEQDSRIGIVGSKLLYPDSGRIQHAGIGWINGLPDHPYRHADKDAEEVSRPRDLDMVTGACLLIRKDLFNEVGGFDEGYLNGVEDIDLCLQVRRLGYRVRYTPKSVLFHFEGVSEGRFAHVTPNLKRFFERWHGCFDAEGRFVSPPKALPVKWEGSQFVYHSLAHVNRELSRELIASGRIDLSIIPYEPHQFTADAEPALRPIEQRISRDLAEPAAVHVRHQWPPRFDAPSEGAWVMIQPWEFGGIPQDWVTPMREQVDEVWVPTAWVRDCYIRSGVPGDKVVVIPNGVNTDLYHPEGSRFPLQTRKRFKFLFLGGAIARKGIDILLETYLQTFSKHDDVCLVIKTNGANGHYRGSALDDEIRRLAMDPDSPEIEYLDRDLSDAEIADLYRACDALVHPYRGEGFGMPIAEAMASALPVIVTGYGACLDFCDAESAYLISATEVALEHHSLPEPSIGYWLAEPDRGHLARLMREVVENPEQAREVGVRARERILSRFQWSHVAQKVLERISVLADRVPLRVSGHDPFTSGRAPLPLEDLRDVALFHPANWLDETWADVVSAYSRAFSANDDVTLLLWLDPALGLDVETLGERLMEVLAQGGSDPEQAPDILLLTDALDRDGLASLYAASDIIVPAGDQEQVARAERMAIPVLDSLEPPAWRDMVRTVMATRAGATLN